MTAGNLKRCVWILTRQGRWTLIGGGSRSVSTEKGSKSCVPSLQWRTLKGTYG